MQATQPSPADEECRCLQRLRPMAHLSRHGWAALLVREGNDLEGPAVGLQPVITTVLAELGTLAGCRLARMSGSGATCYGLFGSRRAAVVAARQLRAIQPNWWVRATTLR
jgi:4-diphosphocytidyl-2-C-methyl-D-erythritol kinase